MKRQIIKIDEEKCNGCGNCVTGCPEGAIQIINGKARLINELFCDGLGACIGDCPLDAITIEEREAAPYNEALVIENIILQGPDVIKAHLKHLHDHNEKVYLSEAIAVLNAKNIAIPEYIGNSTEEGCGCGGGCPSDNFSFKDNPVQKKPGVMQNFMPLSRLEQWPVQLKLLNPEAPIFKGKEIKLLIAADCTPFAHGNFHEEFMKDNKVIMFCPKLDPYIEEYREKLTHIFKNSNIKQITIARMEVPCCSGMPSLVKQAMALSCKNIPVEEKVILIK